MVETTKISDDSDNNIKKHIASLERIKKFIQCADSVAAIQALLAEFTEILALVPSELLPPSLQLDKVEALAQEKINKVHENAIAGNLNDYLKQNPKSALEAEMMIHVIASEVNKYFDSEETKKRDKQYKDFLSKGKGASAREIEDVIATYATHRDKEIEMFDLVIVAKRKLEGLHEEMRKTVASLGESHPETIALAETINRSSLEYDGMSKRAAENVQTRIDVLQSEHIRDRDIPLEDGKVVKTIEDVRYLQSLSEELKGFKKEGGKKLTKQKEELLISKSSRMVGSFIEDLTVEAKTIKPSKTPENPLQRQFKNRYRAL
jgi:hypothetical protein